MLNTAATSISHCQNGTHARIEGRHTVMPAPSWFMSFKESCDLRANLLRLRLDRG